MGLTLLGKIILLAIGIFLICVLLNRKKNIKSSVVYFPISTIAIFLKIQAIKKRYSCLEKIGLNEDGTLFKVEFFGKNKYKAADELDCKLNRRFDGNERHRV